MNAVQPTVLFAALALMPACLAAAEPEMPWLTPGHFGNALDARESSLQAPASWVYSQPPMTVECWVKIRSQR